MSFWSGAKLLDELPRLITPFDSKQIDCAAYTLRVGAEVYISPSNRKEALGRTKRFLDHGQGFVVPPGQFAFLLTEEIVAVPDDSLAFISMKAKIKFRGLVNVSGFHVDPGYRGRLLFAVFNAGPSGVHLSRGDDCFLVWYACLDRRSSYVRDAPPIDGITASLITPIANEVQSLAGLSSRIDKVEADQRVVYNAAIVAIGVFTGLLSALVGVLIGSWFR